MGWFTDRLLLPVVHLPPKILSVMIGSLLSLETVHPKSSLFLFSSFDSLRDNGTLASFDSFFLGDTFSLKDSLWQYVTFILNDSLLRNDTFKDIDSLDLFDAFWNIDSLSLHVTVVPTGSLFSLDTL